VPESIGRVFAAWVEIFVSNKSFAAKG